MLVQTNDGLTHVIRRDEDDGHWGRTFCDVLFTLEPSFQEALERYGEDISPAKTITPPATCFGCLTRSTEP